MNALETGQMNFESSGRPRKSRKLQLGGSLLLVLLSCSCLERKADLNSDAAKQVGLMSSGPAARGNGQTEPDRGRRYVQTIFPKQEQFNEKIPFIGVVTPLQALSLHFALPGRVSWCPAAEGLSVRAGDVICELDARVVDLEIKRARAAVESSQKILSSNFVERQQRLFDAGVIGQTDFEQVRIQSETATASMKDARALLEMALRKKEEHVIRAPWDGVVSTRGFAVGQLVTPEIEVGVLTSGPGSSLLRTEVRLHASWYGRVHKGSKAYVESVAGNKLKSTLSGMVSELSNAIEPQTQSFKVWIDFSADAAAPGLAAQGMLVKGFIDRVVTESGLIVPASSLITWKSDDTAQLFVVDSAHVLRLQEVQVAAYRDDEVLIAAGLARDTRIVRRFAPDLYDGLAVRFNETDLQRKTGEEK